MKKYLLKPGFEFIFSISLIAILCLPPLLFAQTNKDVEIRISNGDTTINGKSLKELSPQERTDAMRDIKHLSDIHFHNSPDMMLMQTDTNMRHRPMHRGFNADGQSFAERRPMMRRDTMGGRTFFRDSTRRRMAFRLKEDDGMDKPQHDREWADEGRFNDDRYHVEMDRRGPGMNREFGPMGFNRRNTQFFNYSNTGSDGMTTHVSFAVSNTREEIMHERKEKTAKEKVTDELELTDLNIIPEFSSGKTLLMFSLPAKTAATVTLTDHDGKTLWTEKAAAGSFTKSFPLGLNGVYELKVKQGEKEVTKRIIKAS